MVLAGVCFLISIVLFFWVLLSVALFFWDWYLSAIFGKKVPYGLKICVALFIVGFLLTEVFHGLLWFLERMIF